MKKPLSIFILLQLMIVAIGYSQIAFEKFNYPAGQSLDGSGNTSDGWSNGWVSLQEPDSSLIVESGLINENLLFETSPNSANLVSIGGNNRYLRLLDTPIDESNEEFWFSISMALDATNLANAGGLIFTDTSKVDLVRFIIGKQFNNRNLFVAGPDAAPAAQTGEQFVGSQARWVVGNMLWDTDAELWKLNLWVDPPADSQPSIESANISDKNINMPVINGIIIRSDGDPGLDMLFDDFYLGDTFDDVVPDDLIPYEPPIDFDQIALEKFNYSAGQSLEGSGISAFGWNGSWMSLQEPDSSVITERGLLIENLLLRTSANSVNVVSIGGNNRYLRLLETPIDESNEEFWFSISMALDATNLANAGGLIFTDTSKVDLVRFIIGKQFNNRNLFVAGPDAAPAAQTGEQFVGSQARWVVGNMLWDNDAELWKLNLWVDPLADSQPSIESANISDKNINMPVINGIIIRADGDRGLDMLFDDFYLGDTFDDVVPDDLAPVAPMPNPVVEKFDYTIGEGIDGKDGGTGFSAPFNLITGTEPLIVEDTIYNYNLLLKTSGKSLRFPYNQGARIVRALDPGYGDNGRSYWLSWMQESEGTGGGAINFMLTDTTTYGPTGPGGQIVRVGKWSNNQFVLESGNVVVPTQTQPWDQAHWVVMYIETNGNEANDNVWLWLNPDPTTVPLRDSADAFVKANLTNWNSLGIKSDGADLGAWFDDIYMSSVFSEVVPEDLLPTDPPIIPEIPIPAVEVFDYAVGEDLDGKDSGEDWGGPWVKSSGLITIGDGSIESNSVNAEGNKASVAQSATDVLYSRELYNKFGTDSLVVWLSFLLDVEDKSATNQGYLGLALDGTPVLEIGGIVGLNRLGVKYNTDAFESSDVHTATGKKWIVARLDMGVSEDNNKTLIWVDPSFDAIPPDNSAAITITDIDFNDGFNQLFLTASGSGQMNMDIDEFRIGFSYRDVANKFGSDDPELLSYEPFNYNAGLSLVGLGGINAFWDGIWNFAGDASSNTYLIGDEGLAYEGLEASGNKLDVSFVEADKRIRIDRLMAFPAVSDGTTYWISYLKETEPTSVLGNVSNIILMNGSEEILAIGRSFGAGKLSILVPGGARDDTEIDDEGLNWLVAKIATAEDPEVPDTAFLWINPPIIDANIEPDTALADAKIVFTRLKDGFNALRIKTEGDGENQIPLITSFDEIRIATAWSSLLGTTTSIIDFNQPSDGLSLQVYPNPTRGRVTVSLHLETSGMVSIDLYDISGRMVSRFYEGYKTPGHQLFDFELTGSGQRLNTGMYFLRVVSNGNTAVQKIILNTSR